MQTEIYGLRVVLIRVLVTQKKFSGSSLSDPFPMHLPGSLTPLDGFSERKVSVCQSELLPGWWMMETEALSHRRQQGGLKHQFLSQIWGLTTRNILRSNVQAEGLHGEIFIVSL